MTDLKKNPSKPKKIKIEEKIDALIFIDTNILLDFYRFQNETSLKYLEEINNHKNTMILTNQVEMEYKKNRQKVLLESINNIKKRPEIISNYPSILREEGSAKKIKELKDQLDVEQQKLIKTIDQIFKSPEEYDQVYIFLDELFMSFGELHYTAKSTKFKEIRDRAKIRFELGFPPRKKDDNSYGDAVNWEWILECAMMQGKDVIIVSRDNDYGVISEKDSYINDWLKNEFQNYVGDKRKVVLTPSLGTAFKMVNIPVTEEMVEEERKVIDSNIFMNYDERLSKYFPSYKNYMQILASEQTQFGPNYNSLGVEAAAKDFKESFSMEDYLAQLIAKNSFNSDEKKK